VHRIFAFAPPSLTDFNVQGALPELQDDFRTLWEDVSAARDTGGSSNAISARWILVGIQHIYDNLQQDTASQTSDHSPLAGDSTATGSVHHLATMPTISSHDDITTNPISQPTVSGGATPQYNEEETTTPAQIYDTPPPPAPIPATCGVPTRAPQSPAGSTVNQSGALPRGPVSSSSSTTSRVAPQAASFSDPNVTPTILPMLLLNNTAVRRGDDDYVEDIPSSTGPSAKALGKRPLIGGESDRLGVDNDTQDPNVPPQPEPPRDTSSQHHQPLS
jgi:hypothetical protein